MHEKAEHNQLSYYPDEDNDRKYGEGQHRK